MIFKEQGIHLKKTKTKIDNNEKEINYKINNLECLIEKNTLVICFFSWKGHHWPWHNTSNILVKVINNDMNEDDEENVTHIPVKPNINNLEVSCLW